MTDKNEASEDAEENRAAFFQEKDLFGLDKTKSIPGEINKSGQISTEQKPEVFNTVLRESEYQSVKHFIILCFFSMGIYPFFWFYKHWRYLKDEKNLEISPGFRTLFIVFSGYSLFSTFQTLAREKGYKGFSPLGFIFLVYSAILLSNIFLKSTFPLISVMAFFSFLLLIPSLNMMNFYYLKEHQDYVVREKMGYDEKIFLAIIWGVMLFFYFFS